MKTAKVLIAALLLAACASTAAWPIDADRAFRSGDYERALTLYREAQAERPSDPMLVEKVAASRDRAVEARIHAARAAVDRGDWAAARAELARARELGAAAESIAAEERAVAAREGSAVDAASRARALLDAGRPGEAEQLLASLGDGARGAPGGPELLARARTEAAGRSSADRAASARATLAAGRAAADRGDFGAAFDALGRGAPVLPGEAAGLRAALGAALRARATAHLDAGRPASAVWFARAARAAEPDHSEASTLLGRATESAAAAHARSLSVGEIADGTGGRCDPAAFRERLSAALRGSAASPLLLVVASGPADVELRGEVTYLDVVDRPVLATERVHEVLVRVEQEPNAAFPEAETALYDARARRADAESSYDAVDLELAELERLGGSARVHAQDGYYYGPYNEAAYYRLLGEARRREAEARAYVARCAREEEAAGEYLAATPRMNERRVLGRVPYVEETVGRAGAARATFTLTGGISFTADAQLQATDRVVRGRADVGLPDDPAELPSPGSLADAVLEKLASAAAARAAGLLAGEGRALIEAARAKERAGDAPGAAESYAAFLLGAGGDLALERANAARILAKAFGFDPHALPGEGAR
jgi:hypothetical protein